MADSPTNADSQYWESEINSYRASTHRNTVGLFSVDVDPQPLKKSSPPPIPRMPPPPLPSSLPCDDIKGEKVQPNGVEYSLSPELSLKKDHRNGYHHDEYEDQDDDDDVTDMEDETPSITHAPGEWVEYQSASGRKIFVHEVSHEVRLKPPHRDSSHSPDEEPMSYNEAELDVSASVENDDMVGELPNFKEVEEIKLESENATSLPALSEAWVPEPQKAARRSSVVSLEAPGLRPFNYMSLDKIVNSLVILQKQVETILESSSLLPTTVVEDLKTVRSKLSAAHNQLEEAPSLDERSDVDALIDFDKLGCVQPSLFRPWPFDSMSVSYYRAHGARAPHVQFEFKDWHFPQYFSNFPLPPGSKTATCVVKLPVNAMNVSSENTITTTRIGVSETHTVRKAIQLALAKVKHAGNKEDFVLKANGLNDFMEGDHLLFDYEYVRKCLRDNQELKLTLLKKPAPLPPLDIDRDPVEEYKAKVDNELELVNPDNHRDLSIRVPWQSLKCIPIHELNNPFRLRIWGVDNCGGEGLPRLAQLEGTITHLFMQSFLFHGVQKIPDSVKETVLVPNGVSPRWGSWVQSEYCKDTLLSALPRGVRLGLLLYGKTGDNKDILVGWAALQLIDERGHLMQGVQDINLWPIPAKEKGKHKKRELDPDFIFRTTVRENLSSRRPAILRIEMDQYCLPVVAHLTDTYRPPNPRVVGMEMPEKSLHKHQQQRLKDLLVSDSLAALTPEDKALLWMMRHNLVQHPRMLPKFLQCVNWGNVDHKFEAHRLLQLWAPPFRLVDALELLDAKYPDHTVREYAVNCLRRMKDDELALYLLQFTQCLKFEPYHTSVLSQFLIERALRSPYEIGHPLFWHLKAELHNPHFCERFGLILEEYLSHAGRMAVELRKQAQTVIKMQRVAEMIVKLKREHQYNDEDTMKEYVKELEKLNADFFEPQGKFQIPFNPKLEATTLIVEKCRYMSSKMVPLWLVFRNADPDAPPIYLMFKSGDDLRQDILTLQMLTVMDKVWLESGLDMRLKPYKCIATGVNDQGEGVGMIEVVMNSDTTSGIQLKYGGGAMGALKMDPIALFLQDHNKGPLYEKAVENFICSCAGYCVATFVLGIGDRHNGNIMVTKDGHLFHIDFGHFLGNFKKKFGVNRERAAFVFTPEMAFVMGGKNYKTHVLFKKFLALCMKAFKSLRENANLLENLFCLMVSAGMPELMKELDIHYLRDKLYLNLQQKKADQELYGEIMKSLDSTYRRIDNMIHNWRHG